MFGKWAALRSTHPRIRTAISAGMDKLEDYMNIIRDVPAYMLAMGKLFGLKATIPNDTL